MPYGVKCNVRAPHKFLRFGALCWVENTNAGSANERFQVCGMSRGGRVVSTWVDAMDVDRYRAGFLYADQTKDMPRFPFDSREAAQAWADDMNTRFGSQPVREHAAAFGTSKEKQNGMV